MNKCFVCGSEKKWKIDYYVDERVEAWAKELGVDSEISWYLCKNCGMVYQYPLSDKRITKRIWESNRVNDVDFAEQISIRRSKSSKQIFGMFSRLTGGKKSILDIGCGYGDLIKLYSDNGWDVLGIDPDPNTKKTHKELNLNTIISQIEDVKIDSTYDIIMFGHSIYFILNITEFLKKLKSNISEDGYLCIVLADFLSSLSNARPSYSHTFYPTGDSIEYLLNSLGYKVEFCKHHKTSIFIAASVLRQGEIINLPKVNTIKLLLMFKTLKLRYFLIGVPFLHIRSFIKKILK